jgi:hypothetical protein
MSSSRFTDYYHASVRWCPPLCVVMLLWFAVHVSAQSPEWIHHATVGEIAVDPISYRGRRISVDALVHRVVGPRIFTIVHTGPTAVAEILVFVPPPQLAAVREGTRAFITGTVRPASTSAIEHEWGSDVASTRRVQSPDRAMLVAEAVIVDGIDVAMDASAAWRSTGMADPRALGPLEDLGRLASSGSAELVGRPVDLRNVEISAVAAGGGFWIASKDEQLFVLPGDTVLSRQGARVNVKGFVLELPDGMRSRLDDDLAARDETIYVYANQVRTL